MSMTLQPSDLRQIPSTDPAYGGLTLGSDPAAPLATLARLAASGRATWPFQQLLSLAGFRADARSTEKSVGAYLFFVTQREVLAILERWAPDNCHAANLLKLAACVGLRPDLIGAIRPFNAGHLVARELRGTLADEPLNAMIAARRAVLRQDDGLAHWLEELRLFLLLRGLNLLEVGARQDRFLAEACTAVRKACDRERSDQITWFRAVASRTSEFADFEADLEHRCKLARTAPGNKADAPLPSPARQLYSTLRRMAIGGAWWDPKSLESPRGQLPGGLLCLREPGLAPPASPPAPPLPPDGAEGVANGPPGSPPGSRFVVHENRRNATPAQSRKHGTRILLQSIEHALYLPATWHRMTAVERSALVGRIGELLVANSMVDRLGAALTLVAWIASRGMFDAETIACGSELGDDWTVDTSSGVVRRKPPRFERSISAASLGPTAGFWLLGLAEQLELHLGNEAASVILEVATQGVPDVGALWRQICPERSLENWFADTLACTPVLKRLTGPILSGAFGATVFEDSQDAVFSRLLSSQARTALPASCAYGSYRIEAVANAFASAPFAGLAVFHPPADSAGAVLNAAGSELDADLKRVAHAIGELLSRYEHVAADPGRWIEAHNQLTCVLVIALLASTGARPVNSPFESLSWLDLSRRLAYVEDKRSGPTTGARICVLSQVATALLQTIYLPHLEALATLLEARCPRFAAALTQLLLKEADIDRPLPLLFFLRAAPDFGWLEVSESQLSAHFGAEWPLPWNIFRHVHAMHLVRRRVHPEIVDALLSHGDRGAEPHGDHSMRIPREDIEAARPHVDALQAEFGLGLPSLAPTLPAGVPLAYADLHPYAERVFGARARAIAHERSQDAARLRAREDILRAIGDRPPSALTAEEWQAIGHDMLFRKSGLPHPGATIRYDVFEEVLRSAWDANRTLFALRRHYRPVPEPTPIFTEDFPRAEERVDAALHSFHALAAAFDIGARKPGPMLAAALGAFELVLACRLAHAATLMDLAHLRRNLRLIRFDKRYWLERANADVWVDGRPVLRVELTACAARWIGIALSAKRRDVSEAPLPEQLTAWARTHTDGATSMVAAVRRLCQLRQQFNAWHHSGAEAAHLSGRQFMAALPHHDWFRLMRLSAPVLPPPTEDAPEFEDGEEPFVVPVGDPGRVAKDSTTAQRCAGLLDGITKLFETDLHDTGAAIAEIRRLTAASGFAHGDGPQVLAHFACVLLTRKSRTGKKLRLRAVTARRYWYSLAGPFIDLAHDRCLIDEDEESIREFYEDIVAWWDAHVEETGATPANNASSGSELTAEESKAARVYDAARRTVAQLKDFQDFAAKTYGVEELDWSGIDLGARVALGRPALILETEVRAALEALVGGIDIIQIPDHRLAAAFVLIACARFGLRVSEAVGLYRDDWVDVDGAIVVLIRSNAIRSLKTLHSRRQVPLVEQLGPVERQVIAEIIRRWNLHHAAGASALLLPGVSAVSFRAAKANISGTLRSLLKQVTRSADARVHGLRHSFACRLLALLRGLSPGPGLEVDREAYLHARKLLLGSDRLDRRAIWSIARMLGHASPTTTIRCYLHMLELMMERQPEAARWGGAGIDVGALIDLDAVEVHAAYGQAPVLPAVDPLPAESLALRRTRFLALVTGGHRPGSALETSRLAEQELDALIDLLRHLPNHDAEGMAVVTKSETLKSIGAARLRELAALIEPDTSGGLLLPTDVPNLGVPIGSRRQLVLHTRQHFLAVQSFVKVLGLTPTDLRLVTVRGLHSRTRDWIAEAGLDGFVAPAEEAGKDFRLDTAEQGDPPEPVTNRAVLVPSVDAARRIRTTQELLIAWVVMHAAQTSTPKEATVQAVTGSAVTSASLKSGN
ncbi:MAG: site-specific integrase [Burkholderiales bacterium]|nr:site-specific integrase [Burkholderiales bacterium]